QKRKNEICPFSSLAFFQPTTVDKEPIKKQALRKLGKPYFKLFLASSPLHFKVRDKRFNEPFYFAIG
ncbi:hypothetical protein OLF89_10700, partial [Streptococcus pneumoniae]|nr:hypothetical protein [Streptococcus pneumoniae]MDG7229164.1 hypothetical protein [Streptococcus pneumoniae]MDG9417099.1 hypothetical protein [Streptococcus pneumoniae]